MKKYNKMKYSIDYRNEYKYRNELRELKPWDTVEGSRISYSVTPDKDHPAQGMLYIATPSHGYYVIPHESKGLTNLCKKNQLGAVGKLATYLEEDNEISEFVKLINK